MILTLLARADLDFCGTQVYPVWAFNPSTIQAAGDYTLTITGTGTASSGYYSSKTVTFRVYHSLSGTGIQTDPYVINNVDDWTVFAYNVNNSVTSYSDQFVKLNADIPTADDIAAGKSITTTIGTSNSNCFQGTFDGGGNGPARVPRK